MQPDSAIHRARRERVLEQMGEGVMVIATAPEVPRNRDTHYPYRHDSYFYWLTGFNEPEAVVVLIGGKHPRHVLFCRERNEEREIWDGFRYGPQAARETFAFDEAYAYDTLQTEVPRLLENQPLLAYIIGRDMAWDTQVMGWLNVVRSKARSGVRAPDRLVDARVWLDEFRLVKDAHELALMRRAAEISDGAHRAAMRATRPGRHEYEIEAELLCAFRSGGAESPAYTSIVASGANACVLHYVFNNQPLREGDLLLIDAAAEFGSYAADITRTFPVSGRYTAAQKDVYELVLAAQRAAIDAVRPGNHWNTPHETAVRVLTQGLVDLGLLAGAVDGLIESQAYSRFYMHRTGHWLGMDVHDAGEYKLHGEWRSLQPGMTLTVEPGLYIRPADDVPQAFWNIGIRIEDDVAVTESACEVLTHAPKTVAEIEAWMRP
ncbi:putative XAA-PRO aminopeptidase [Thiobacillus denitrificans ATCC 25259]|uniref:Xaa-Pro aminopeptidase n=1 Tax=Thiobacillus denitrificans (strain ATCC 25259 / T1) TaxID=292415 RepID=Q3SGG3_THIDA|nr:aminopeptidase P N-terminal domain-containing protein [Thiobacillus denitrificans]AAZ98287.1 putative XAA-PRO aminopeptidase [Thiobacillus denitrificans ATCC 25259]